MVPRGKRKPTNQTTNTYAEKISHKNISQIDSHIYKEVENSIYHVRTRCLLFDSEQERKEMGDVNEI